MIKVISFDIGGVLKGKNQTRDSSTVLYEWARKNGIDEKKITKYTRLSNNSIEQFCRLIDCKDAEELKAMLKPYNANKKMDDETYALLKRLKEQGLKIMTISNGVSIVNTNFHNDVEKIFDLQLNSYESCSLKPAIKMFKQAEKYFHMPGSCFLHIGDNRNDIIGANRAGWTSVLLGKKGTKLEYSESLSVPDFTINSLKEIISILKDLDKNEV